MRNEMSVIAFLADVVGHGVAAEAWNPEDCPA